MMDLDISVQLAFFSLLLPYALHYWLAKVANSWFIFDPFNVFLAGCFIIYIVEFWDNHDGYLQRHGETVVVRTLYLVSFGLTCSVVGYRLRFARNIFNCIPKPPAKVNLKPIFFMSLSLFLVGAFAWFEIIVASGGLVVWASESRGNVEWSKISGYTSTLTHLSYAGPLTLLIIVESKRIGGWLRIFSWLLLLLNVVFYMYIGSRSRVILLVMTGMAAFCIPRQKNIPIWALFPLVLTMLYIVKFIAIYRDGFKNFAFSLGGDSLKDVIEKVVFQGSVSAGGGDGYVPVGSELNLTFAVVKYVPKVINFNYGKEFLQTFTQPIPRALWPDKPYPRGEAWSLIHELEGSSLHWVEHVAKPFLSGPAPGFAASWFYMGGVVGLLLGGLVVGMSLKALRIFQDQAKGSDGVSVLSALLLMIGFSEAVSHPLEWLYRLPFLIVPLFLILRWSKYTSGAVER